MTKTTRGAFNSMADLKLWSKTEETGSFTLADIPSIIPLRWTYFRDNWDFLKDDLLNKVPSYVFPDMLNTQIKELDKFITRQRNSTNQTVNPFSKGSILGDYYAVWESIDVSSIPLTKQEEDIVDSNTNRVSAFIRTDFENIRKNLISARDKLADEVGLTDSDYNAAFTRSSISALRDARIKDITQMQTYMAGVRMVDYILANSPTLRTTSVDPFALARANANNEDIEIENGLSGNLVVMNFGDSLQSLASRYLGDPDRWIEIAIANGLKPPYIDEIGQTISIIANGDANQLNIAGIDMQGNNNIDKLYIGQVVFLQSDLIKYPEQRTIVDIKEIPISGEIVLEFSGDIDLDKYKLNENTTIRVYKPNTINSNFMVLIPSPQPIPSQQPGDTPFFLLTKSEDEKRQGVDLLINDDGDIAFTSNNDVQFSYGLTNALQAIKLKIITEQGSLARHLTYGLPNIMGRKATDPTQLQQIIIESLQQSVSADPRFDRIESLDVRRITGNTLTIGLVVRLAGSGTQIPISFNVNTG